MKQALMILVLIVCCCMIGSTALDEARAVKNWLDAPFSSAGLEAERDAKVKAIQNPVKGEFETNAQFEQRKQDAANQVKAI